MARWTDLAEWRGPTPNQGPAMVEWRGLVVHIAEGSFEGTIAWQKNPDADVSSHFVVAKDGRIAQCVDTATAAWTQRDGNGHWLSVENEGFHTGALTDAQVEANAQLLARGHLEYGYPLQLATSPSGRGLGHHSMGAESGANWGHSQCPGELIKAQKPAILARAIEIVNGDDDMDAEQWEYLQNLSHTVRAMAQGKDSARQVTQTGGNFTKAPDLDLKPFYARIAAEVAKNPGGSVTVDVDAIAKAVNDDAASRLAG